MSDNKGYDASREKLLESSKRTKESAMARYKALNKKCPFCGESIPYNKRRSTFCNRHCSCSYNNSKFPKRKKQEKIKKKRVAVDWSLKTKGELKDKASSWQSWRTQIRKHAKQVITDNNIEYKCVHCGYETHNQICHIIGVAEFDNTCLLSEINHISNLMYLCPTHHWEFDHGHLVL